MNGLRAAAGVLLGILCAAAHADSDQRRTSWNVENTGQPTLDAQFTVSEGTWMSVDVSPDGSTLVFDLLGDIYAIPASGGEARLVHGGAAMQRAAEFSSDGRELLYISDASGSDNVWISNADGTNARQLTRATVDSLTGPTWGPGGAFIGAARLFGNDRQLHASELRIFDLRGGEGRVVVPAPANGENVHEPQFSSDGRYLYYTEKVTPPSASVVYVDASHGHYAIRQRDLSSGETRELIRGFGGATTPVLSHDDRLLAFVRRVKDKTVLFVYDLETGRQWPVLDGLDRDAQADFIWQGSYYPDFGWFPDNRHIAIWGKGKLWKVDIDNASASEIPFRAQAKHKITVAPRFTHDLAPKTFTVRAIRQLTYSPDGRTAVFNALGRLWRKNADAAPVRLTRSGALEFEPAFSRDGRTLAYVEWSDETGGTLELARADGSQSRALLTSAGVLRSPSFSADGRRLAFVIDNGDRCLGGHEAKPGIYWVDVAGGEPRYVAPPGMAPQFSPDGRRIYFSVAEYDGELVTRLKSVTVDGYDARVHAQTPNADTTELRISPDLRWIAFRDRHRYYVARYQELGAPMTVSAAASEYPVEPIGGEGSDPGGYSLTWSADSSRVYWTLGPTINSVRIADVVAQKAPRRETIDVGLQATSDVPSGTIAFTNARLITMKSSEPVIERGTLVIDGNRIAAIGRPEDVGVPRGAKVFDAAGKTIMPGLIDMHGHIDNCYYTSSGLMPQKQPSRYADLAYGVTTNYDPYTSELPSYSMSEMTLAGEMVGPRGIESGLIAFGRSGKGDSSFLPVESYADARTFMQRKRALGGIIAKSYRQPMRSQRQQLIKAGREAGVMVDVEGESNFFHNITMLLDGNTNLQHNLPVATYYDDVVQLMARGRTSHTPTLVTTFGELFGENYIYQHTRVWEDPKAQTFVQATTSGYSPLGTPHYAPPYVRGMTSIHAADELWDIGFRSVARSMKKLDDAGVVVAVGSHGQVAGLAQHWEMWLLAEGGMSPYNVLRAATLNGAKALGLDSQIGTLEAGKLADLIVLDANPLEDIRNSNTVRHTIVNGRWYESATMNEIGNYDRPRGKFFWEAGRTRNIIDWKKAWAHP